MCGLRMRLTTELRINSMCCVRARNVMTGASRHTLKIETRAAVGWFFDRVRTTVVRAATQRYSLYFYPFLLSHATAPPFCYFANSRSGPIVAGQAQGGATWQQWQPSGPAQANQCESHTLFILGGFISARKSSVWLIHVRLWDTFNCVLLWLGTLCLIQTLMKSKH